jgi:hypothetical protein
VELTFEVVWPATNFSLDPDHMSSEVIGDRIVVELFGGGTSEFGAMVEIPESITITVPVAMPDLGVYSVAATLNESDWPPTGFFTPSWTADAKVSVGEPRLDGVAITLTGTDGQDNAVGPIDVTTDSNGRYGSGELLPGTYTVTETVPEGYFSSTATSFDVILQSGQEQVAAPGMAEIPPGDPRDEVAVAPALRFGNFRMDFGDAPDSYGTLRASDGARHALSSLFLGAGVDIEADGQPGDSALGDDTDADGDDDDGVQFVTPLVPGLDATVRVTASGAGELSVWIDFDRSGTFDNSGEKFTASLAGSGTFGVTIAVPAGLPSSSTYARFRFSSVAVADPTGAAIDGEVEDYQVSVVPNRPPTDIDLSSTGVAENQPAGTIVGTFSTADLDLPSDSYTYELVTGDGDTDNDSFAIYGDQLKTTAMFDFETKSSYAIRVRTTDTGGLWYEEAFTIAVMDLDDPLVTVIDDGDPDWSAAGTWDLWTRSGFGKDLRYHAPHGGTDVAVWQFSDLVPGVYYRVSATWPERADRATDAPFTISRGPNARTVLIDQRLAPQTYPQAFQADDGTIDTWFADLADAFRADAPTLTVSLGTSATGYVIADAVRLFSTFE